MPEVIFNDDVPFCPNCENEISYEFDYIDGEQVNIECPNCKCKLRITVSRPVEFMTEVISRN